MCQNGRVTNVQVFRPTSNLVLAVVVFAMCFMMMVANITQGNQRDILVTFFWVIAISTLAYLIFMRPKVILFDEGITIVNPFITVTAGWHMVEAIDAKYTMSILVGDKTIYAWAAPAPSRYHSRSIHESDIRGLGIENSGMIRPGESPRSHSGAATYLARRRFSEFQSKGIIGAQGSVEINNAGITILLLCLLGAIAFSYFQF